MKKLALIFIIIHCQLSIVNSFAQMPQSFKYQAVVRDAAGILSVNKIISVRTSVLAGSATGSSVYTETQTLSTNEYGVVALNIGAGTLVSGNFSTINWGAATYFVKTELDINGGSTYVFMGTSQILSVPYALYAEKTGSSLSDNDTSATNELQTLSIAGKNLNISNGNTVVLPQDSLSIAGYTLGITNGNTVNLPAPQTISIVGDSLHISNANAVYLSGSVDLDASPTNELQNLTLNNDTLKISLGNNVVFPHDNDRDSINELQTLSLTQGSLKISQKNTVHLPDSSATNELQTLSINQGSLSISLKNTIHLPDSSSTNELQTLTINQGTLSITDGNNVHLPDSSSTNELQILSITKDSMKITQGNSVYLNSTQSLQFPEGTVGQGLVLTYPSTYSIPNGKNFYITYDQDGTGGCIIYQSCPYTYSHGLPVISEGTQISLQCGFLSGVLVNKNLDVQIIDVILTGSTSYIVPSGKTFYIKSFDIYLKVNGVNMGAFQSTEQMLIVPSGTVLTICCSQTQRVTGYLK